MGKNIELADLLTKEQGVKLKMEALRTGRTPRELLIELAGGFPNPLEEHIGSIGLTDFPEPVQARLCLEALRTRRTVRELIIEAVCQQWDLDTVERAGKTDG